MKKIKLDIVVGTRPEIIRLSQVIKLAETTFDLRLVHTGQNFDFTLSGIFFKELGIRDPDVQLNCAGKNSAETIANVISKTYELFASDRPDAVLILGDTNSCMAALSAKRLQIPIFHMEAGNRCFDMRVPEEINRKIVDHIADINLPYSDIAREFLLAEGLKADQIVKTGSPMYEVLDHYSPQIKKSDILNRLGLDEQRYFVLSAHREENVDNPTKIQEFLNALDSISSRFKLPFVLSCHPRLKQAIDRFDFALSENFIVREPFGFFDYVWLQKNSKAVLSDSGTITEEASILGFPALNIRETHERHEGMEAGAVMMVGFDFNRIEQALGILIGDDLVKNEKSEMPNDYNVLNVSFKVVKIIVSYINFVNERTWRK